MVETITPVVYEGRTRWTVALGLHVLGATTTAALFGGGRGCAGGLLEAPWGRAGWLALAAVATLYAVGELPRVSTAVPQLRRQVPDWWRGFFSWPVAAALYGARTRHRVLHLPGARHVGGGGGRSVRVGGPVRSARRSFGAFGLVAGSRPPEAPGPNRRASPSS